MISLSDRRTRGDMIATYKIISGKDKVDPVLLFEMAGAGARPRTRRAAGVNNIRVVQARLEIRRNSFSQRVVSTWNSLPGTVKNVETVLTFKVAYDEWVNGGGWELEEGEEDCNPISTQPQAREGTFLQCHTKWRQE